MEIKWDENYEVRKSGRWGEVRVGEYSGKKIAMKRIPLTYLSRQHEKYENALGKEIKNENVVKLILHDEQDLLFRYFGLELCNASLDQLFLDDKDPRKFGHPMPFHDDILMQLATGMEYIHSKDLVYVNASPQNVLIYLDNDPTINWKGHSRVVMKWADFGLSNWALKTEELLSSEEFRNRLQNLENIDDDIKGPVIWLAPELWKPVVWPESLMDRDDNEDVEDEQLVMSKQKESVSVKGDVYSEGLVFAYILLGGIHLWSSIYQWIRNVLYSPTELPKNIDKLNSTPYRDLIAKMVAHDPNDRITSSDVVKELKVIAEEKQLEITKDLLDRGRYGYVFRGRWRGRDVAVKRVFISEVDNQREEEAMKLFSRPRNHPNIIELLDVRKDDDFARYVLELCEASLEKLFLDENDPKKYKGPMPSDDDVIYQLAIGLEYIHRKKVIHRDIKPENVLIWVESAVRRTDDKPPRVLMKWADFGLCKQTNENGSYSLSALRGTEKWMAPELLNTVAPPKRGTTKSDVFAEGLVFGYFLLGGAHIYGESYNIPVNIMNGRTVNMNGIKPSEVREIIKAMLVFPPEGRINSSEVVVQLKRLRNQKLTNADKHIFNQSEGAHPIKLSRLTVNDDVNVNCVDGDGFTPFIRLIKNRNFNGHQLVVIADNFIKKGMDVNYRTKSGQNVLHILSENHQLDGLIDTMELLLEHEINIDCKDSYGRTALHALCRSCGSKNLLVVAQFLVTEGIDVHCKDDDGWNALHYVCQNYEQDDLNDVIQFFIEENGVDVNSLKNDGENILHVLCRNYEGVYMIDIIKYLIELKIDLNCKTSLADNALDILHEFYKGDDLEAIVKVLHLSGMDISSSKRKKKILDHVRSFEDTPFKEEIEKRLM